jgi:hypothetical protein
MAALTAVAVLVSSKSSWYLYFIWQRLHYQQQCDAVARSKVLIEPENLHYCDAISSSSTGATYIYRGNSASSSTADETTSTSGCATSASIAALVRVITPVSVE